MKFCVKNFTEKSYLVSKFRKCGTVSGYIKKQNFQQKLIIVEIKISRKKNL
jgi:hypothetical protein